MNKVLQARLKARERIVSIDGHAYTIRRPKPAEMMQDMTRLDLMRRFVVGWDVQAIELVPGGVPEVEPFDADLFADWLEDNPDLWQPLSDAILEDWNAYLARKESATKN